MTVGAFIGTLALLLLLRASARTHWLAASAVTGGACLINWAIAAVSGASDRLDLCTLTLMQPYVPVTEIPSGPEQERAVFPLTRFCNRDFNIIPGWFNAFILALFIACCASIVGLILTSLFTRSRTDSTR